MPASPPPLSTRCVVAGGGPAGMMLGYLLARAGVDVVVLEKHGDFLRDFRGDTIHPSTLEVFRQLGLLDRFRPLLQNEIRRLDVVVSGHRLTPVDFSTLPGPCAFLGLMPQWDFLDFLAAEARRYPTFHLVMQGGGDRPALGGGASAACHGPDPRRGAGGDRRPHRRRRRPRLAGPCPGRPGGARARGAGRRAVVPPAKAGAGAPPPSPTSSAATLGPDHSTAGPTTRAGMLIPKGDLAADPGRRACRPCRERLVRARPGAARPSSATLESLGPGQAAVGAGQPPESGGTGPGCCASATPRTRCHRRSVSASTTRCRTPSPPRNLLAADLRRGPVPDVGPRAGAAAAGAAGAADAADPAAAAPARHPPRRAGGPGAGEHPRSGPGLRLGRAVQPVVQRAAARLVGLGFRPERVQPDP